MRGPIGRSCASYWNFRLEIGERAVSAVRAVNAAGDSRGPFLGGPKASSLLAGKCRRKGCVSKRHFAASGVARRVVGGDIIAREEPRE